MSTTRIITLRGIDFSGVKAIKGRRGLCEVTLIMKDGSTKTLDSYPGEDFYMRCCAALAAAWKIE